MSEFSEYQVVDAPGDLGEPGGTNGAHDGYADSVVTQPRHAVHADELSRDVPAPTDTWGSHLPALRLSAVSASDDDPQRDEAPSAVPPGPVPTDDLAAPPHWLRPARCLVGIVLLALAWAATVAVLVLARLLLGGFAQEPSLPMRLGLDLLTAMGAAWLAIVALACVVAAAFSLGLAITSRGW